MRFSARLPNTFLSLDSSSSSDFSVSSSSSSSTDSGSSSTVSSDSTGASVFSGSSGFSVPSDSSDGSSTTISLLLQVVLPVFLRLSFRPPSVATRVYRLNTIVY